MHLADDVTGDGPAIPRRTGGLLPHAAGEPVPATVAVVGRLVVGAVVVLGRRPVAGSRSVVAG